MVIVTTIKTKTVKQFSLLYRTPMEHEMDMGNNDVLAGRKMPRLSQQTLENAIFLPISDAQSYGRSRKTEG